MPEHDVRLRVLEEELSRQIEQLPPSRIREAMGYSLLAGGKRLRPMLLFAAMDAYGQDWHAALPVSCAIEMMHTYSLIHDDMPEMDNDTLRRGRPCCHVQFGDTVALLAGDALQTLSFQNAADTPDPAKAGKLCALLARKAGAAGMCLGQDLDLAAEDNGHVSLEQLEEIEQYKTGCLFELPLAAAAILCDAPQDIPAWDSIGRTLGILFQIQDDLLERESSEEQMGKSLSDAGNNKATALSLFGLEEGKRRAAAGFEDIEGQLASMQIDSAPVRALFDTMKNRTH